MNDKNKLSIYLMHKYWGKKPSEELSKIISLYTKKNDTILDPFSGFGGIAIESILQNRNIIINDLNPIATFISTAILDKNVDIKKTKKIFNQIKSNYTDFSKKWYKYNNGYILTILRNKENIPIKLRVLYEKTIKEISLQSNEISDFLNQENSFKITTWFPNNNLIVNSRISAKKDMKISDLFPKRALICQSYLFDLISKLKDSSEKDLILLAFTSNLANCSKLVPPIKSRGEMSQGT